MPEQTYYLVIPGTIRGDATLDTFAKILYGEIANKCNLKGYCWASNESLAEIMGSSVRTLQRGFSLLQKRNHIVVQVIKNQEGTERRIWLREGYVAECHAGAPAASIPPATAGTGGHDAGVTQIIQSSDNSKGKSQTGSARASEHEGVVWPWETETFWEAWVQWREYKLKEHRFRYKLVGSEQAALNELQRLSGDSEVTAHAIMQQARANGWKGFYALKNVENESNRGTTAGGGKKTGTSDARIDALRRW